MTNNQFTFELVIPEKLFASKPVAMVTVPGGEGEYGVLSGHAPMITTVKPGVITIYEENETSASERIFVSGGFAEVNENSCTVLAGEAIEVVDLDPASLKLEAKLLTESLQTLQDTAERAKTETTLAIIEAKLQAIAA